MQRKKSCNKFLHIFMTVLILVNTLTSLTVFAESNDQPFLKLEKISKGKTDDQLDLQIMTRSGQENEKVQVSQPVIQQAVLEQDDQRIPLTVENEQSIIVPTQSTGSGVIHLTLKDTRTQKRARLFKVQKRQLQIQRKNQQKQMNQQISVTIFQMEMERS